MRKEESEIEVFVFELRDNSFFYCNFSLVSETLLAVRIIRKLLSFTEENLKVTRYWRIISLSWEYIEVKRVSFAFNLNESEERLSGWRSKEGDSRIQEFLLLLLGDHYFIQFVEVCHQIVFGLVHQRLCFVFSFKFYEILWNLGIELFFKLVHFFRKPILTWIKSRAFSYPQLGEALSQTYIFSYHLLCRALTQKRLQRSFLSAKLRSKGSLYLDVDRFLRLSKLTLKFLMLFAILLRHELLFWLWIHETLLVFRSLGDSRLEKLPLRVFPGLSCQICKRFYFYCLYFFLLQQLPSRSKFRLSRS